MALRELILELGVDVDEGDIEKSVSALDQVKDAAIALGAIFTTGLLAAGYKNLVALGSQAAEAQNKFTAVFIESSEAVQKQLDDTSRRTGIASTELIEFASNIGAIVKPALGSSEAAGKVGATMAELALDIASFNDVRPDEALVALRSGLIGSAEPLQRFGVDVRVAALEQEKLRLGIQGSIKSLTEGQRIQIRQSAILRQLGAQGALGDATKTADGFANATRGLSSQLEDLGKVIGGFLLKDAATTAVKFREIITSINLWFRANERVIQQGVDSFFQVINSVIEGVVMTVGFLVGGFNALSEAIGPVASNLLLVVGIITALVLILGAPIVLLLAMSAAIALVIEDLVVFAKGGKSAFGQLVESIKEFLDQFIGLDRIQAFSDEFVKIVGGIWDEVVVLWESTLEPFFSEMLARASDFISTAIDKSAELLDGLGEKIGDSLKTIFKGTVGRIIIDFLGAKAGAVVGEFIGRLVGKLLAKINTLGGAGKIFGSSALGEFVQERRSELIEGASALIGEVGGGVGGALLADELALGIQERLGAGRTSQSISPAAGTAGFSNQSTTTFNMEIDASGQDNPNDIADAVGNSVRDAGDVLQLRQTRDAFSVASAAAAP